MFISKRADFREACKGVGDAVGSGTIGELVAQNNALISCYYEDVLDQASRSFRAAWVAAGIGFAVLILAALYALGVNALGVFGIVRGSSSADGSLGWIGSAVSGTVIEGVACVHFWLYSRAARQFGAFHICLERTHRYLMAFKIAEKIEGNRDETLKDLACIMANAPMITRQDIDTDINLPVVARKPQEQKAAP
jgi:hypothetical protein